VVTHPTCQAPHRDDAGTTPKYSERSYMYIKWISNSFNRSLIPGFDKCSIGYVSNL